MSLLGPPSKPQSPVKPSSPEVVSIQVGDQVYLKADPTPEDLWVVLELKKSNTLDCALCRRRSWPPHWCATWLQLERLSLQPWPKAKPKKIEIERR